MCIRDSIFKGGENDKAVLCTDDKTYEVKEAETSNSLVLIPNLKFPEELKQTNENEMMIDHKTVNISLHLHKILDLYIMLIPPIIGRF